jgi:hypothetical protein
MLTSDSKGSKQSRLLRQLRNSNHRGGMAQPESAEALWADRGELIGKMTDQLVAGLNIRVSNLPPYRPEHALRII